MHELSIAQEILEIVNQYVPDPVENKVSIVKVKIGKLSNILPDTLTFCFDALISETPLNGAKLMINHIPLTIKCKRCNKNSEIEKLAFACIHCGSNNINVIAGNELQVEEIEINDEIAEES